MSNDDAPKDGEVTSFRTRRRTRRGKRRSLRVPVDEVPRRSAADDVSAPTSDAPMPLHSQHPPAPGDAADDALEEVAQAVPGSVPAPPLAEEPVALDADEADAGELDAEELEAAELVDAEHADEALTHAADVPRPPAVPSDLEVPRASSPPPPSEPPSARESSGSSPPPARRDSVIVRGTVRVSDYPDARRGGAAEARRSEAAEVRDSEAPGTAEARRSEPPDARSAEPPEASSASEPSEVRPEPPEPPRSVPPPPPPSSVPPPPVEEDAGLSAEAPDAVAPQEESVPHAPEPETEEPARAEARGSEPPPDEEADAEPLGAVEPAEASAEEETPPLELAPERAVEAGVVDPEEPLDIELGDEDIESDLRGDPTVVTETAPRDGARASVETADEDESTEITIEEASEEELAAFGIGIGSDELEVDFEDEPEPAEDEPAEDEPEELELAEEDALEELPVSATPRSQPPPTPSDPPVAMPSDPLAAPAAAAAPAAEPAAPEPDKGAPPPPPGGEGQRPAAEPVATEPRPRRRRKPWWEDFFNDDYLRTVRPYPPRYIRRQCDYIEQQLGLERGATILDVGCGLGLHAVELASRGYLVVGLDLSLPMLSRAADEAQDRGLKINFLHGDMREMTFDGAFDAVLCWGTTLGYFDEDTNRKVIERLYRALKPMGCLLIDVVNRDHVIRHQPNLVWFEGDGCVCMEETQFNYITSRLEVKRTVILDDGRQRENVYSIRLYSLNEIGSFLHTQGFRVASVSGHEAHPGVFFGADSPRMIIMAERRLGPTTRETPKEGTPRVVDKPPPPPQGKKEGAEAEASTEVASEVELEQVEAELVEADTGEHELPPED